MNTTKLFSIEYATTSQCTTKTDNFLTESTHPNPFYFENIVFRTDSADGCELYNQTKENQNRFSNCSYRTINKNSSKRYSKSNSHDRNRFTENVISEKG